MSRSDHKIAGLIISLSFFAALLGGAQEIDQPSDAMEDYAVEDAFAAAWDDQTAESPYFVLNVNGSQAETLACVSIEGPTETNESEISNLTDVNPAADINVGDKPVCTITAPSIVCEGSRSNSASVPSQPGASYVWIVTHGVITAGQYTNQITWDSIDDKNVTISVSAKKKYGSAECTCTGSAIVQVIPKPVCTITVSSGSVCAGSEGHTAEVPDQGPTASYTWEIVNGDITGGLSTNQIEWKARDLSPITIKVTVNKTIDSEVCTCKNSVQIQVQKNPSCTITAPTGVCAGSTGNTASVPYTSGATYSWTLTNGQITSGQGMNLITWKAGDVSPATIAVTVIKTIGGTKCTCTGSRDVLVYALPDCTIFAPTGVCAGSSENYASIPPGDPGAAILWTIDNGDILNGQGTNQIQWKAFSTSPVTIGVTVTEYHGSQPCSGRGSVQVLVYPNPVCTITAPKNVCVNAAGNKASVPYQDPATYDWKITNGEITGGLNTNEITWKAGETTPVIIEVTVTKDYGSTTCSCKGS